MWATDRGLDRRRLERAGLLALTSLATTLLLQGCDRPQANPAASVVKIHVGDNASGTGFAIAPGGFVVTNAHVIKGDRADAPPEAGIVAFWDAGRERRVPYQIIAVDDRLDLALLQVDALLPPLRSGAGPPAVGAAVWTLGFPSVLDAEWDALEAVALTRGSVVKMDRVRWGLDGAEPNSIDAIFHSAVISGGASGSPLLDQCGHVIGVNTLSTSATPFALASTTTELLRFLSDRVTVAPVAVCGTDAERLGSYLTLGALGLLAGGTFIAVAFRRNAGTAEQASARRTPLASGPGVSASPVQGLSAWRLGPHRLPASAEGCVVGREALLCDLVLPAPEISRRHLRIRSDAGALILEDLNSKAGTRLNGRPLRPFEPSSAGEGDRIALGEHEFVVRRMPDDGAGPEGTG